MTQTSEEAQFHNVVQDLKCTNQSHIISANYTGPQSLTTITTNT